MSGYTNDHLGADYMPGLGLHQAPFTSTHEDKFLYLDAERQQCNDMLQHSIQHSNLLLVVTGEHGMGKTSLLQHFLKTAHGDWSLSVVQANTMMDAHQLLASIAQGFGLQVSSQPASVLQETLYQYLTTIQRNGRAPVLLIDDAHELPKDSLEALFTLADTETGEDNLLRIIMFCEPQIEIMLESPAIQPLSERITHTIHLPAFNEEQTAEYIKHRLAVCGFTGASPFQPKDINKIFKISQGIPARINELAHLHLLGEEYAIPEPEHLPEEYTQLFYSKKQLAIGIVVITVVMVLLLFQSSSNLNKETVTMELPVTTKIEKTIPPSIPDTPTSIKPTIELNEISKPDIPPVKTHIRSILPNPVIGSSEKQLILINGEGFSKNTQITVSWSGNKKELDPDQVIYENNNQLSIKITPGNNADKWTLQASDPEHGSSNIFQFKVTDAPAIGLQTISWINRQNPQHFTLHRLSVAAIT